MRACISIAVVKVNKLAVFCPPLNEIKASKLASQLFFYIFNTGEGTAHTGVI